METNELDVLVPERSGIRVGDDFIEVGPLRYEQVPPIARLVKQITATLDLRPYVKAGETESDAIDLDDIAWGPLMLDLMAEHGESLAELIALAVDRPVDVIGKLPVDHFVELGTKVFKENWRFFTLRVLPTLLAALPEALPSVPSTTSSASSSTDTDSGT